MSVDGVDDARNFSETVDAFEMLKIPIENQREIFRVIAGVLLLGNIRFTDVVKASIRVIFCKVDRCTVTNISSKYFL